jgi:hypothetical protein
MLGNPIAPPSAQRSQHCVHRLSLFDAMSIVLFSVPSLQFLDVYISKTTGDAGTESSVFSGVFSHVDAYG